MGTIEGEKQEIPHGTPVAGGAPIEAIIGREIAKRVVVVGPVIVVTAWLLRGGLGAVSAAVGVAVVVANFLLSGVILSRAARVSLQVYHAAALFGFFVRLGLITLSMLLVATVFEVDRPAMGIAAVVAYLALLSWEAWAVTNGARKDLEWTN